ncbi:hypothetical protein EJ02DRAFT_444658 [Clathrospora elynae]|uniref:Acid protease n=1 Tax=Clathrospora elynae TaxID=706981 RepID=A0A6A5SLT6_9PLEO|nr:hypothetical protein EJ02DRAFT_444658 [Clathrospora elynae]
MSSRTRAPAPLVLQNSGRWLGNDGTCFYIHAGTPPQYFHVLPSILGQALYLPIDVDSSPTRMNITDCGQSRGVEIFQSRPSPGFQPNASSTWDEGHLSYRPRARLKRIPVAAFAKSDIWLGELGLSLFALNVSETERPHSFLNQLKEERHISSLSFGYQARAPYRFTKVPGSLNDTLLVPSTEDVTVGLQSVEATLGNGTVVTLLDEGILAVIDTNGPELWLPPFACDAIAEAFGLTYFEATDRYALTDAAHSELQGTSPMFNFKIGTSISGGRTINIEIPYAAFDVQASYPIFATTTNYFPLRRAADESQFALGRVQAVFISPPPEPDLVTIEPKETLILIPGPTPGSLEGLSPGAIAGIVIGSVLIVLAVLSWWLWNRKQKAKIYAADTSILPRDGKDLGKFATEAAGK